MVGGHRLLLMVQQYSGFIWVLLHWCMLLVSVNVFALSFAMSPWPSSSVDDGDLLCCSTHLFIAFAIVCRSILTSLVSCFMLVSPMFVHISSFSTCAKWVADATMASALLIVGIVMYLCLKNTVLAMHPGFLFRSSWSPQKTNSIHTFDPWHGFPMNWPVEYRESGCILTGVSPDSNINKWPVVMES